MLNTEAGFKYLSANRQSLEGSFALIITTNDHERRAVLDVLESYVQLSTTLHRRVYLGAISDRIVLILDGPGGYSNEHAIVRILGRYLSDQYLPKPWIVVLCGICWGNPAWAKVGQVVIADRIVSCNKTTAGVGGLAFNAQTVLSTLHGDVWWEGALERLPLDLALSGKTILSAEQLLQDTPTRDHLLKTFPESIGGEMEAFAAVPECNSAKVPWLVIKGVSDNGDSDFSRSGQPKAGQAAAKILYEIFLQASSDGYPEHIAICDNLTNILQFTRGSVLHIYRQQLDMNQLSLSLQTRFNGFGGMLQAHSAVDAIDESLGVQMNRTCFELALNAFKHGQANHVQISVEYSSFTYCDDGLAYEIEQLATTETPRGGAETWRITTSQYIDSGMLAVQQLAEQKIFKNRIQFQFPQAEMELSAIRENCTAGLIFKDHRMGVATIQFDSNCKEIYVDFRPLMYISVIMDVCDSIAEVIEGGGIIYAIATDEFTIAKIKDRFSLEIMNKQIMLLGSAS